jgi:hypothetical protein
MFIILRREALSMTGEYRIKCDVYMNGDFVNLRNDPLARRQISDLGTYFDYFPREIFSQNSRVFVNKFSGVLIV